MTGSRGQRRTAKESRALIIFTCTVLAQSSIVSQQSAAMTVTSEAGEDEERSMPAFRKLNDGRNCIALIDSRIR
jgi:hypothetical protein